MNTATSMKSAWPIKPAGFCFRDRPQFRPPPAYQLFGFVNSSSGDRPRPRRKFGDRQTGRHRRGTGLALLSRGVRVYSGSRVGDDSHLCFDPPREAHHHAGAAASLTGTLVGPG
jgi:hypothetical protein